MGIRFSKSIKLGKYLKINISKSGVSATVGKKGASVNLGTKGTYLNLSPTAVGIKGTGLSYRQKITGGIGDLVGLVKSKKEEKAAATAETAAEAVAANAIEILIHKDNIKVSTAKEFAASVEKQDNDGAKEIYQKSMEGDEETIESLVNIFLDNLDLGYEVAANYDLVGHDLYIDLDLPEIENFNVEEKNKKEDYGNAILSLSIYLAGNFFNISSYIEKIIISGFTTLRDKAGEEKDTYLYSVKYTRDIFEKTDFKKVDDPYKFMTGFENRINMDNKFNFKAIEPYEIPAEEKANIFETLANKAPEETSSALNPNLESAINSLKQIGYTSEEIQAVVPQLLQKDLGDALAYMTEALKLLPAKK